MIECGVLEAELRARGHSRVVGVDEAGRGPLAGPVVAAAVMLPTAWPEDLRGVDDSKKLSAERREQLFERLICERYGIGWASVEEIDEVNILQATLLAMGRALEALWRDDDPTDVPILIDGKQTVPGEVYGNQVACVRGDARSVAIASASILAKVTRDRHMCGLASKYPGYGFEVHKGYGTKLHLEALGAYGVTSAHRRSFAPVSRMLMGSDD